MHTDKSQKAPKTAFAIADLWTFNLCNKSLPKKFILVISALSTGGSVAASLSSWAQASAVALTLQARLSFFCPRRQQAPRLFMPRNARSLATNIQTAARTLENIRHGRKSSLKLNTHLSQGRFSWTQPLLR